MIPDDMKLLELALLIIIATELAIISIFVIATLSFPIWDAAPDVSYYLRNCDNLTLYPEGCKVY